MQGISFEDYRSHDTLGLAQLVRRGEVSAEELLETAIVRAEAVQPTLNPLARRLYPEGRETARAHPIDGPLAGVPFLLKDIGVYMTGTVTTHGSRLFDEPADHDSTLVERYRRAGLVIFGKTTTPELGMAASTETSLFGDTRNPWDPRLTSGGSSGGAAVAVATGVVPAAHASDGGGSIRIPSSACGLFGLKPTRARIPSGPDAGEGWGSLTTNHVISRSVRDSAALLDATHGPAPGDPYRAPPAPRSYLDLVSTPPRPLRIAAHSEPLSGVPVHADCREAVRRTAEWLESLGHTVEEACPPGDGEALGNAIWTLVAVNVSRTVKARMREVGREPTTADVERVTWSALEYCDGLPVESYPEAIATIHHHGRLLAGFHDRYDLVLSPTLASPPIPRGPQHMNNPDVAEYRHALLGFSPFTGLYNATGQPSMSVPLHWTREGLPVGVMFSAPFGDEATLFRLAGQLESMHPWAHRIPEITSDA